MGLIQHLIRSISLMTCLENCCTVWVVSKTKTEARSTQISKTKHPKLENEAHYLENEAP